jgi:hypothetical protein
MQGFQKFVLFIAIILLTIVLIFIGFALRKKSTAVWPPVIGDCPDYWIDTSGNGAGCVNIKNLGNGTCKPTGTDKYLTMDFTQPSFVGGAGLCAKYNWANSCGVTWDGITYGATNPCTATGTTLAGSSFGGACTLGSASSQIGSNLAITEDSITNLYSSAKTSFTDAASSAQSNISYGLSNLTQ